MLKKSFLAMAIVSVLAAGCSNSSSDPEVIQASKVSGSVAKGIVKQGIVNAYAMNADGTHGADAVGTAVTDDKGLYSLTLNDSYDGTSPLLIELTAGDDTTMVCDSRDGCGTGKAFGDDIPLVGTGFKLTAISAAASDGATVNASITPFTSMAASNVIAGGAVSDSSVSAANSEISQIVGVNIATTNPVNIDGDLASGDADQQQYTIMLAALAKQAFTDTNADGVDVADVIANLTAFNTDASDDDIGSTGGLSLTELYDDVALEVTAAGDDLNAEAKDSTTSFANTLGAVVTSNGGTLTPEATTGQNATEVAQAKTFVSEVRTWANALESLETPTDVFLEEAGTITDTLDSISQAVLEIFAMAVAAVANEVGEAEDNNRDVASSIELMDNGESIGTINLTDTSTSSATTIAMSASDLSGVTAAGTISLNSSLSTEEIAAGDVILSLDGTASNSDIALSLSNAAFTITLTEAVTIGNDDDNDDKGDEPPLGGMSLVAELLAESLDDGVASGDKMTADVEIKLVTLNDTVGPSLNNDMNLNLEKIALTNLAVTNAAGSTAGLSASLVMNNATSFDAVSYLSYEPVVEKGISNDFDIGDLDLSVAEELFGITNFYNLKYNPYGQFFNGAFQTGLHTCANGADENNMFVDYICFEGDAGIPAVITPKYSNYAHVSNVTLKDFSYENNRISGYVELQIDEMETAENFLDATLNITGKVDLASDSEAMLSITANKTGIETGNLTATLAYSGKSLKLEAITATGGDDITDGSLSFSNADGTAMTIVGNEDFTTGNVTVSGKEVGNIEDLNGGLIMRYNDGTFESL